MDSTTARGSFSNANRHMQEEEELQLTTVGVDIGSSTSHLVFSRLQLTLQGSATFFRLQSFSLGLVEGLKDILAKGYPLTLVNDGDIGGIVGLHFREELQLQNPIISIDGIALNDFDYIDIGALIPSSGSVPVVIKSLIFPASSQQ